MKNHKFSPEIEKELRVLYHPKLLRGLYGLLYDYSIIGIAIFLSMKVSMYFYPLSIIVIGGRIRALATLLHDGVHLRLSSNRVINNFVGKYMIGLFILQSFDAYKKTHVIEHHMHLKNINKDPDFQFYTEMGIYKKQSKRSFLIKYVISPLFFFRIVFFIKYLIVNRFYNKEHPIESFQMVTLWLIIMSFAYYFHILQFLFLFWFVPLFFIFPVVGWFVELVEHYPLARDSNLEIMSSINRESNLIENFITGAHSDSYHLVHHLKPGLPYWNLAKAHKIMMRDKLYAEMNQNNGGIFFSRSGNQSLISRMIDHRFNPIIEV